MEPSLSWFNGITYSQAAAVKSISLQGFFILAWLLSSALHLLVNLLTATIGIVAPMEVGTDITEISRFSSVNVSNQ